MEKVLITYFSASGVTRRVAEKISKILSADLIEIEPEQAYTREDLDWTDKNSRSTIEMNDKSFRPKIKNKELKLEDYTTVVIGFPVWWYTAPTIINTFIEENDLTGKDVYIFATSGGSSESKSFNDLKNMYPNINFISGKRLTGNEPDTEISEWIK